MNQRHKRPIIEFGITAVMLLGLPPLGLWLADIPLPAYFEFPPGPRTIAHAPFSWTVFGIYAVLIAASVLPLLFRALRSVRHTPSKPGPASVFPWWGWAGAAAGLVMWVLAWTRFKWLAGFQPHTFTPLWLCYILVANAMSVRRNGRSLMTSRPVYFLTLFPASAVFWWFFEYLNRFVQNWQYEGAHSGATQYFWYATLPFATVLPAVLSTRELIRPQPWLQNGFRNFLKPRCRRPRLVAVGVLILAAAGLSGIGVWPDTFFSLLWIAPLLIILSLQILFEEPNLLTEVAAGDWRTVVASALAALVCGWFWEMWNAGSLAHWTYSVPYLQRFKIFEMPALGYAGYLPFGLACAVIGDLIDRTG
ncbi:MAG: hypothetical protein WAM73_17145 [Desulfobacterales bacterium]